MISYLSCFKFSHSVRVIKKADYKWSPLSLRHSGASVVYKKSIKKKDEWRKDWHSQFVPGFLCGRSQDQFTGVTSNP